MLAAVPALVVAVFIAAGAGQGMPTFAVQGAATVDFGGASFQVTGHPESCFNFFGMHFCTCQTGSTAPVGYVPDSCTSTTATFSTSMIATDMPTQSIVGNTSSVFSIAGARDPCNCASPAFTMPEWPVGTLAATFTCAVDANGAVTARGVQTPSVATRQTGGTAELADGAPTTQGCSVATATWHGLTWSTSGRQAATCPVETTSMALTGTVVAKGWCCVDTQLVVDWSPGYLGCYGTLRSV